MGQDQNIQNIAGRAAGARPSRLLESSHLNVRGLYYYTVAKTLAWVLDTSDYYFSHVSHFNFCLRRAGMAPYIVKYSRITVSIYMGATRVHACDADER